MNSGTLLQTSVCTRQNPIPPLEAFVSNCIGNLELKCLSIEPAGSVMISFTFVSAASSTSPHSYLLHFLRSPCHNTMACFRSGFWSLNRLTNPMRLLKMVMSFSAGNLAIAATRSGFILVHSWLMIYPANCTTGPNWHFFLDKVIPHFEHHWNTILIRKSSCA